MIYFFSRLFLYILVLLSIKGLLMNVTNPLNKDPDTLLQKIRLVDKQNVSTNAIFIGSSRTYTGLIPSQFDSLTQRTHSLNLGVSNLCMPYTADVCQYVLSRPELPVRYILFELSSPGGGVDPFVGNPLTDVAFLCQHWSVSRTDSEANPVSNLFNHLNEYMYNLLSPVGPIYLLRLKLAPLEVKLAGLKARIFSPSPQPQTATKNHPVPVQQLVENKNLEVFPDGYITSKRQLPEPSPALLEIRQRGLRIYQADSLATNYAHSFYYVKKLNALHQLAATKGIRLLFFLPNRLTAEDTQFLIPIFRQLAPDQRLDIPYGARFEQLFEPRFSMDNAHLNDNGARIYTTLMAEAFQKQVSR